MTIGLRSNVWHVLTDVKKPAADSIFVTRRRLVPRQLATDRPILKRSEVAVALIPLVKAFPQMQGWFKAE